MRYVTYVLKPHREYFDPGEVFMRENGVTPEAVLDTDVLNDGSIVQRLAVRGSRADVRSCITPGEGRVLNCQVTDVSERKILQLHVYPSPLTQALLDVHQRHAVLLEYPLEFVGSSNQNLRVTEVGPEDELRQLIADTRQVIDVEIEQLGSYDPSADRLITTLTARQREVLQIAVEKGYYEVPRRVTYDDIAEHLDCSAGAVGQHLRRIESTILTEIVTGTQPLEEPPSVTVSE